jgi:hypothetical protein
LRTTAHLFELLLRLRNGLLRLLTLATGASRLLLDIFFGLARVTNRSELVPSFLHFLITSFALVTRIGRIRKALP